MIKSAGKVGIDMIGKAGINTDIIPPEWEPDCIASCCKRKGDSIGSRSIIMRCRAETVHAMKFIKNF